MVASADSFRSPRDISESAFEEICKNYKIPLEHRDLLRSKVGPYVDDSPLHEILESKKRGEFTDVELKVLSALRVVARQRVLFNVHVGAMTRDDANAWAGKRGETFEEFPDAAEFDPMAEEFWTLAMTTAWIIWRSPDAVREAWQDYRREFLVWAPVETVERIDGSEGAVPKKDYRKHVVINHGWELRRPSPVSRYSVLSRALSRDSDEQVLAPLIAADELDSKLQSGELKATGIPRGSDEDVDMPRENWARFPYINDEDEWPDAVFSTKGGNPRYDGVLLPRRRVLEIWQRIESKANIKPIVATNPIHPRRAYASEEQIRAAIRLIYDWVSRKGVAAPNKDRIAKPVLAVLSRDNLIATWRAIQSLAIEEPCQNKLKQGTRPETEGLEPFPDIDDWDTSQIIDFFDL